MNMHILTYGPYEGKRLGDGKEAGRVFDRVISAMEEEGVGVRDYWLAAGTLLGIYRGEGFIPGDTDIDIEMVGNDKFDAVARALYKVDGGRPIRVVGDGEFVYQMAYIFDDSVIFDVFFYKALPDRLLSWSEVSGGDISYPREFLNHMSEVKFRDRVFSCFEPEMYLEFLYGKGWRIPKEEKPSWKPL